MTAKDLKNALLQEAVQGKLVPQIASEGNARDLLEEIRKERLSHGLDFANAKSGKKSKKETALAGSNPCDILQEVPFDIPESWCWCRLGDCVNIQSSKRVFEKDYVSSGIPFYRSKEIGELSRGHSINTEFFITEEHFNKLKNTVGLPQKGDILLCSIGGSIGNTWINDGRAFYYKDGNVTQICNNQFVDTVFINYYLHSELFTKQVKSEVAGSAYNALTIIKIKNLIFPLPPLSEQKRIVAAIEKFMPLIEEYGKKETVLNELNAQIGTLTKKAILQEAVQGKLVPQMPAEGNAKDLLEQIKVQKAALIKEGKIKKEKPLPEITEDEIPFDIPENWCWCRLGEIFQVIMGQSPEGINVGETIEGIEFHQGKIFFTDRYIAKSNQQTSEITKIAEPESILLCMRAPVGKVNLTNRKICIGRGLSAIVPLGGLLIEWAFHLFETLEYDFIKKSTGSTFKAITGDIVKEELIPLPPLSEQKRIVAAIEQLLPLCEKLGR